MIFGWRRLKEELKEEIRKLRAEKSTLREEKEYTREIVELKNQIASLYIEKSRIEECHAREDRELKHMIGLEKKRQEVEAAQAKREAKIEVREEFLEQQRFQFNEQMKFQREQFDKEMRRLEDIYKTIIERLPTVTVDRIIEEKRNGDI